MQLTSKKWATISVIAGILVYYCEWLELVSPGFCNQGWEFTIVRMYGLPLLLMVVLGFYCYESPIRSWLLFMLPSWIVRLTLLLQLQTGPGNLWPLLLGVDIAHLLLTGVVIGVVAKLRAKRIEL